jgi:hypothetical protein
MAKAKEPERFYAAGYYVTKIDDHTFEIPKGIADTAADWNNRHAGLQKMLEGVASYVADQRGALYREQQTFWDKFYDEVGLPRGTQATLHFDTMTIKVAPVTPEQIATLKIGEPAR